MKTKTNDYPVPPPRKGWAWVRGKVLKTDRFKNYEGDLCPLNDADARSETEGPNIWHEDGSPRFKTSGYIRRVRK